MAVLHIRRLHVRDRQPIEVVPVRAFVCGFCQ